MRVFRVGAVVMIAAGLLASMALAQADFKQFESESARPQAHLSVDVGTFDHVTLTDPLGKKTTYWYVTYTLSNRSDQVSDGAKDFFRQLDRTEEWGQPIDVRLSVSLIVDVPEGVNNKEKLQNMFRRCELPADLRTVAMDDMIQREDEQTGRAIEEIVKRSAEDVHSLEQQIHEENAQLWNHLHQVRRDEDTYFYSRSQWLSWFKSYREGNFPAAKEKLESLYGRKLTDASQFFTVLDPPKSVRIGEGSAAKTLQIKYEPIQIQAGESLHCVAIFPDISPEADYIGVMFEGLVDPVFRKDDWKKADGLDERTYVERKVLLACFARLGDEFKRDQDKVQFIGKNWIVLERYPVDYGKDEFNSSQDDVVPPDTWSDETESEQDDVPSLRQRNEQLVK